MVHGLCQMLTQQALMVGVSLNLVPAIASLLLALVGLAPTLAGQEMVFSALHAHWTSFIGISVTSLWNMLYFALMCVCVCVLGGAF